MDTSTASISFKAENALRILTPWWDVGLKYITSAIVTIAAAMLPLQATKDTLSCIVVVDCPNSTTTGICEISDKTALSTFLNLACFQSLGMPTQFFYLVLLGEALLLLFANNIWSVLNPKTSLTLSHFISIVSECYNSIGTPDQISSLLDPTREASMDRHGGKGMRSKEMEEPLLVEPFLVSCEHIQEDPELDNDSKSRIKTIYHKVKKFTDVQMEKKSLFFLYLFQQFLQVIFSCAIIVINITFYSNFSDEFKCSLRSSEFLPMKYEYIACYRYIAPTYSAVSWVFIAFVFLYFFLASAVCVVMRKSATIPAFTDSNDLDFLCFLLNQYSTFQYERFALFDQKTKKGLSKTHGSIVFS